MPIDETEYQSLARDVREHMAREEKQWEDLIRAVRDNQRVIERVTTQLEAHAVLLDELKDPLDAWRSWLAGRRLLITVGKAAAWFVTLATAYNFYRMTGK